jgi:hypothetical protein
VRAVSPFARGGAERPVHTVHHGAHSATAAASAGTGVSERSRVFWADAGTRTVSVQRRSRSSSRSSGCSSSSSRSSDSGGEQGYSQIDSLDEQHPDVKASVNSSSSADTTPSTAAATVVSRYSTKVVGRGAAAAATTTTAGVYSQLDALDIS